MRDNIDIDKPEKWLTGTSQVQEGEAQSPVSGEELYQAGTRASWGPPSWAGKLLSGKALEVLESTKVNTSQICTLLGSWAALSAASRPREGILLLCSAPVSTFSAGSNLGLLSSEECGEGLWRWWWRHWRNSASREDGTIEPGEGLGRSYPCL